MTAQGILRGTGLSRLAEDERWNAASVVDLKDVPWDWQGTELVERTLPKNSANSASSPTITLPGPQKEGSSRKSVLHDKSRCETAQRQTAPHTRNCRERLEEALLAEGGPRFMAYRERRRCAQARTAGRAGRKCGDRRDRDIGTSEAAGAAQAPNPKTTAGASRCRSFN
eukprot:4520959-Amphidinium_carterae.5